MLERIVQQSSDIDLLSRAGDETDLYVVNVLCIWPRYVNYVSCLGARISYYYTNGILSNLQHTAVHSSYLSKIFLPHNGAHQ